MKRVYRLYADENTVGYLPPPGEAYPSTDVVLRREAVPHGATVRVFEVLARDPLRSLGRYCSPMIQQTAVLLRHEVIASPPEGVEWDDEQTEELFEWCDTLAQDLQAECLQNYATNPWYGMSSFDDMPYVEVEVEVDDDDLEGLDEHDLERKFEDRLGEDEGSNPTWVVLAPEDRYRVGPDPSWEDNEGEE